ncbi:MAG TPA: DUF29 domain-containing protein [Gemmataceae bacterium]|nr:DUF29 domain-containing protein [Gemmataceae bacterium]
MTRNHAQTSERRTARSQASWNRLYLEDETAWLDLMSQLVKERRFDELDRKNLSEYLNDMAKRDRREVLSRLRILLIHRLKWDYQPRRRSKSWKNTIFEQQSELEFDFESKTLRNHAQDVLPKAYGKAVVAAARETELPESTFPRECPYTLDALLSDEWEHPHGE